MYSIETLIKTYSYVMEQKNETLHLLFAFIVFIQLQIWCKRVNASVESTGSVYIYETLTCLLLFLNHPSTFPLI